jgi:hypothetical protein
LAALSSGLESVEERVEALQQQLGQHSRDAAALELQLAAAHTTIGAAAGLLAALAAEYQAWETDVSTPLLTYSLVMYIRVDFKVITISVISVIFYFYV